MSVIFDKKSNKLIYDRKLKDGSGEMMYGIQVAQSLDLDEEFIERCYNIRNKYNENNDSVMDSKETNYNSKKIKSKICEICRENPSCDTHHLQFQVNADKKGIINIGGKTQSVYDFVRKDNKIVQTAYQKKKYEHRCAI